jgi:hypothetical protein
MFGQVFPLSFLSAYLHFSTNSYKSYRISAGAGPGSKGGARKNYEARLISWTGRASRFLPKTWPIPMWGRHALRVTGHPMGPPHYAESRKDLRIECFPRRCFLHAPPLLPGHKPAFSQKRQPQKVKGGKILSLIDFLPTIYAKMGRNRPGGNCSSKNTEKTR